MATTLTAATLTVTLTEAISLNGYDQGSKNTLSISSINEVHKRILTVPTSEIEVLAISTANASGTFIEGDVRYIRITNLDDTNHVTLTFKNENDEFEVTTHAVFPHILISAKCGKKYWIFREKSEKCEIGKFEIFYA